jgi:DNA-binding GntR family transcriptional regulator
MQNRHHQIADAIRKRLFALPDPTRDRMTEDELVRQFRVSRTPVREALSVLELEGLIERRKNRGISLREPSLREMAEMYDVRAVLEGYAGRVVAAGASAAAMARLAGLARRYRQARDAGRGRAAARADLAFHDRLIQLAGNEVLERIMGRFSLLRQTFLRWHGGEATAGVQDSPFPHEDIMAALQARDAGESERLLRAHVQWARRALIERSTGIRLHSAGMPEKE